MSNTHDIDAPPEPAARRPALPDREAVGSAISKWVDKALETHGRFDSHELADAIIALFALSPAQAERVPLDVILHCPSCKVQHIDEPHDGWENPPHRTHLCQSCGHLWRAANVATNGVAMLSAAPKEGEVLSRNGVETSAATLHGALTNEGGK